MGHFTWRPKYALLLPGINSPKKALLRNTEYCYIFDSGHSAQQYI
jgi:hypothetical protein